LNTYLPHQNPPEFTIGALILEKQNSSPENKKKGGKAINRGRMNLIQNKKQLTHETPYDDLD